MRKQSFPDLDHQLHRNAKHDNILRVGKPSLDGIEQDENQRDDLEHKEIFLHKDIVKSSLN